MVRIPVPEDYDSGHVSVAGTADYHYGEADVNTDAVRHARDLSVRADDDGRYVGCSEHYADEVRAFLGVADAPEICGAELSDGGTCDRPADECPYHGGDS
jgi:hypothetical protein